MLVAQPDHGAPPTVPIAGAQHILHMPGAPPTVPLVMGPHVPSQPGAPHAEPIAMGPHVPSQPGAPHAEPIASMGPHVLSQPGAPQAMPIATADAQPSAAADDEEVNLENTHQSKVEYPCLLYLLCHNLEVTSNIFRVCHGVCGVLDCLFMSS